MEFKSMAAWTATVSSLHRAGAPHNNATQGKATHAIQTNLLLASFPHRRPFPLNQGWPAPVPASQFVCQPASQPGWVSLQSKWRVRSGHRGEEGRRDRGWAGRNLIRQTDKTGGFLFFLLFISLLLFRVVFSLSLCHSFTLSPFQYFVRLTFHPSASPLLSFPSSFFYFLIIIPFLFYRIASPWLP